jgi:acetyl esterase/lipase
MHPDHLNDVQAALQLLQEKYAFKDQYVLVGHSVGATLSFQAVMSKVQGADPTSIASPQPRAVAGVCGIYDLRLIRNDFKQIPIYDEFLKGALGLDEELWDRISPGKVADSDGVASGWQNGQLAVLASSTGDLVINKNQADAMIKILEQWKGLAEGRDVVELNDLREGHDEVWSKGEELANVIIITIQRLTES